MINTLERKCALANKKEAFNNILQWKLVSTREDKSFIQTTLFYINRRWYCRRVEGRDPKLVCESGKHGGKI